MNISQIRNSKFPSTNPKMAALPPLLASLLLAIIAGLFLSPSLLSSSEQKQTTIRCCYTYNSYFNHHGLRDREGGGKREGMGSGVGREGFGGRKNASRLFMACVLRLYSSCARLLAVIVCFAVTKSLISVTLPACCAILHHRTPDCCEADDATKTTTTWLHCSLTHR